MTDLTSESDLIRHASRGDNAAWEALVLLHREAVFRLAYLLIGDADDAEDLAQETFIRAYRALARFDTSRPMRPWLLRIVTNLARNRHRAVGRYVAAVRRWFWSEGTVPTDEGRSGIETRAETQWQAHLLWQAVRRLSQTDQEIIYLRYFLDLSVDETAEALEVASGTVKSRLHRALKHLRGVVERDFPALAEARLV